jgi:hypothetical protein
MEDRCASAGSWRDALEIVIAFGPAKFAPAGGAPIPVKVGIRKEESSN